MTHDNIEEFSTEEFDRTFKTNVYAMFWLCKAAVPRMQPGSVILNTASIQSYDPSPNLLAYASTKGAIVNFTKGLSKVSGIIRPSAGPHSRASLLRCMSSSGRMSRTMSLAKCTERPAARARTKASRRTFSSTCSDYSTL
jgi:hypothetical protein